MSMKKNIMKTNMKKVRFSCSSLGDLMTNSKSKSDPLSETAKKKLIQIYIKQKYGRVKDIDNKYFAKGRIAEEASIKMLSEFQDKDYYKNDVYLSNDFVHGFPDVIDDDVKEIKTPFDIFTYHNAKYSKIEKSYYWQIQGYLWLTGLEKAQLVYCLVDTPDFIINQEKKRLSYQMDIVEEEELYYDKCQQIEKNLRYSDIDLKDRIHIFEVERNEDDIEKLKLRLDECRIFLETLLNNNKNLAQ